ncbi:MAG: diflavin flavoprotein [Synechocystis sp.]|jgi:flavorubredoxin/flavin reductase (DIM6/NTAB) family NADH-FMN oxidoreductase RutF
MVATPLPTQKRLSTQTQAIAAQTLAIRSLDWDRDRFDIEFGLQNGTTYNSYLIQGDKVALVDSSHEKFRQLYLDLLTDLIDPSRIDYLIVSHTEPDHSGLVKDILQLAPHITVVATKVALQFLDNFVHQPFERIQVKSGDRLDLGQGHNLEFVSAPNLHWPDTMLTYDPATQILFTCDVFGMHYCSDVLFDEDLSKIEPDYQFYYDCLMGPNARSVLAAMKRMEGLGDITTVANGHGPLLRHNVTELLHRYRQWSESQSKAEKNVVVFYVADYGYGDRLSQAIAKGITKTGIGVDMVDLSSADPQEINELVANASGIVLGMPPLNANSELSTNFGAVLAVVNPKQTFGLYESYGGNDEPIDPLRTKFLDLGLREGFTAIKVKDSPNENTYQLCDESGTDLGQTFAQAAKIKKLKSLDNELEKAIGRISGGLYIITAQKSDVKGAMLASWVSQASFNPPGFTVAVAKDRAIESLLQVGDRFVLNILEEGNYQPLMKHFLKRFPPGADRFAGVKIQTATNGSPILTDALAYLECEVTSRMECSDHWIVYSTVTNGRVAKTEGLTAVHHRKVGNYY